MKDYPKRKTRKHWKNQQAELDYNQFIENQSKLVPVGGVSERLLIITNVGSNNIVIKTEDTGRTAANRFALSLKKVLDV
jgi:hypothetical protein